MHNADRVLGGQLQGAEGTSNVHQVIGGKRLTVGSDKYYQHVWNSKIYVKTENLK
jgi:hypothetical protein